MANVPLTGNTISSSYQGLLKAGDSGAIGATEKIITDGLANASTLSLGTSSASFTGTLDLSGATVTGLPDNNTTYDLASAQSGSDVNVNLTGSDATTDTVTLAAGTNITLTDNGSNQITIDAAGGGGAAGLVSGTGTDSMISDSSLTTLPATGAGNCSISLGNDAQASQQFDISIGHATRGGGQYGVALGHTASSAGGGFGIAVGCGAQAVGGGQNYAIGKNAKAQILSENIAIGTNSDSRGNAGAISIGCGARQTGILTGVAAIGKDAQVSATGAQAYGWSASATAQNAVAIGCNLTASRADTTASCQFEALQVGKGVVVTSPDGLTTLGIGIDNTGAIVTYTP